MLFGPLKDNRLSICNHRIRKDRIGKFTFLVFRQHIPVHAKSACRYYMKAHKKMHSVQINIYLRFGFSLKFICSGINKIDRAYSAFFTTKTIKIASIYKSIQWEHFSYKKKLLFLYASSRASFSVWIFTAYITQRKVTMFVFYYIKHEKENFTITTLSLTCIRYKTNFFFDESNESVMVVLQVLFSIFDLFPYNHYQCLITSFTEFGFIWSQIPIVEGLNNHFNNLIKYYCQRKWKLSVNIKPIHFCPTLIELSLINNTITIWMKAFHFGHYQVYYLVIILEKKAITIKNGIQSVKKKSQRFFHFFLFEMKEYGLHYNQSCWLENVMKRIQWIMNNLSVVV